MKTKATRAADREPAASWESDPTFQAAYEREYPYEHVADALLQLRAELGWTQQELAERAGTTQSVIARAESGRHSFRIDLIDRIAQAAGLGWRPRFDRVPAEGDGLVVLANVARPASSVYAVTDVQASVDDMGRDLALKANANG